MIGMHHHRSFGNPFASGSILPLIGAKFSYLEPSHDDVAQRLLDAAVARLDAAGLGSQIESQRRASATDLSHVPTASCDVVLLLGPLYHLLTTSERRQAIGEAAR